MGNSVWCNIGNKSRFAMGQNVQQNTCDSLSPNVLNKTVLSLFSSQIVRPAICPVFQLPIWSGWSAGKGSTRRLDLACKFKNVGKCTSKLWSESMRSEGISVTKLGVFLSFLAFLFLIIVFSTSFCAHFKYFGSSEIKRKIEKGLDYTVTTKPAHN